jgi:hypothetical protein
MNLNALHVGGSRALLAISLSALAAGAAHADVLVPYGSPYDSGPTMQGYRFLVGEYTPVGATDFTTDLSATTGTSAWGLTVSSVWQYTSTAADVGSDVYLNFTAYQPFEDLTGPSYDGAFGYIDLSLNENIYGPTGAYFFYNANANFGDSAYGASLSDENTGGDTFTGPTTPNTFTGSKSSDADILAISNGTADVGTMQISLQWQFSPTAAGQVFELDLPISASAPQPKVAGVPSPAGALSFLIAAAGTLRRKFQSKT